MADSTNKLRIAIFVLVVIIVAVSFHRQRAMFRQRLRDARVERNASRNGTKATDAPPPTSAVPAAGSWDDCRAVSVGYRVLTIKHRPVALWYPTSAQPTNYEYSPAFSSELAFNGPATMACGKRVPLVVFSHGDTGCGLQSVALTEELARHGYVVAAPDHADAALCHTVKPTGHLPPAKQLNVFKPETWDESSFADRRDDVEQLIAQLLASTEFQPIIDAEKIGAAGHSLGGYTVVAMAGAWPSWTDSRIRAVLALSPYVMPFQLKRTLAGVRVPLMYQGGTLDVGITPFLVGEKGAYAGANPPAYLLVLKDAAHLAWANCGTQRTTASCISENTNVRLIVDYGIAFFDRYLKNISEPVLEHKEPALAGYQFKLGGQ